MERTEAELFPIRAVADAGGARRSLRRLVAAIGETRERKGRSAREREEKGNEWVPASGLGLTRVGLTQPTGG